MFHILSKYFNGFLRHQLENLQFVIEIDGYEANYDRVLGRWLFSKGVANITWNELPLWFKDAVLVNSVALGKAVVPGSIHGANSMKFDKMLLDWLESPIWRSFDEDGFDLFYHLGSLLPDPEKCGFDTQKTLVYHYREMGGYSNMGSVNTLRWIITEFLHEMYLLPIEEARKVVNRFLARAIELEYPLDPSKMPRRLRKRQQ